MTERLNNNNDKGGIIYNGDKESLASGVGEDSSESLGLQGDPK